MAPRLLLLLFLPGSLSLRLDESWVELPSGPKVEPVGRHIQMLHWGFGVGLTDRMRKYLLPLVALGRYHNATVHLLDGAAGAKRYLAPKHTQELAESWGRYFDLKANGGNPFHAPENFRGCREIKEGFNTDELLGLFSKRELCVNFLTQVPPIGALPLAIRESGADLPLSREVLGAAGRFLRRYNVAESYGSVHVRRCDYVSVTRSCTEPEVIANSVAGLAGSHLQTWLFFLYAETGYRKRLARALEPLKIRALFEDDVVLNDVHPQDNYFTYLLGKYLNGGAESIVETHMCTQPPPLVLKGKDVQGHGVYLQQILSEDAEQAQDAGDLFLEHEEATAAICDSKPRGAKLLTPR